MLAQAIVEIFQIIALHLFVAAAAYDCPVGMITLVALRQTFEIWARGNRQPGCQMKT